MEDISEKYYCILEEGRWTAHVEVILVGNQVSGRIISNVALTKADRNEISGEKTFFFSGSEEDPGNGKMSLARRQTIAGDSWLVLVPNADEPVNPRLRFIGFDIHLARPDLSNVEERLFVQDLRPLCETNLPNFFRRHFNRAIGTITQRMNSIAKAEELP